MRDSRTRYLRIGALGAVLATLLIVSLACAAKPTPVPPAAPAPTVARTLAPAPTSTPVVAVAPTATPLVALKPQYGGTFRYARTPDGKTMDVLFDSNAGMQMASHFWSDTLVDIDTELKIVPRLARSWSVSSDGKVITFRLGQAKFHDGTDFNARAIKAYFDRMFDPQVGSVYKGDFDRLIREVRVDDESTVSFILQRPSRIALSLLTSYGAHIQSSSAIQKYNSYSNRAGEYGRNPVGTGPFRFVEWVVDSHMTFQRFESYWEAGKPYLDRILWQHVGDPTVKLAMIRTGETDLIDFVEPKDLPLVRGNPNLQVGELPRGRFRSLGISTDVEPWSNRALRAAMAYAINRDNLAATYYEGAAEPAHTPISVGWAYNSTLRVYAFDLQKAKEKLIEAGYPKGKTLPYWCASTAADIQLCEIIQAYWRDAGISTEIVLVPPADISPKAAKREIHLYNRWRGPRADPGIQLQQTFHSKGSGNFMGYSNPEVDKLIDQAEGIYDIAEAKKIYDQVQRTVAEDAPHIFTVFMKEFVVMNKNVQNFQFIPDLYVRADSLWLKK